MKIFLLPPPGLPVPAVKGGAVETLLTHLIHENEKSGKLELILCCTPDDEAAKLASEFKYTRIYYIPFEENKQRAWGPVCGMQRRLGICAPLNYWYNEVMKVVKKERPDYFVAEGGDLTEPQAICRYMGREKCFAHLHMQLTASPVLESMYGHIIAISQFVADSYQNTRPVKKHLVFNCVDNTLFNPYKTYESESSDLRAKYGYDPDDFIVLFCGRICPEKGIHRLIHAIKQINDPKIKLHIVGSPFFAAQQTDSFMAELQKEAAELKSQITFTGFLHNSLLPPQYRMADAACFPALWDEPAGITAIEAMACGCPVIATESGGMPEYLQDSNAILLKRDASIDNCGTTRFFNTSNLEIQLTNTIVLLKNDSDKRKLMSIAGVHRSKTYSSTNYFDAFVGALSV